MNYHLRNAPEASPRALVDARAATGASLHRLTQSPAYSRALSQLDRYATLDGVPALIEGETGTGKTFFARALHEGSPRSRRAYYHVNLAALEDSLASSDLFGHLSGAFTGASHRRTGLFPSADGGTLFLDEIGQSSLAIQRKILLAVEYGEVWQVGADRPVRVNVRVIAASSRPLADLVVERRVLHDLVPRIAAFRIYVPALRERREDIALLAEAFLARDAARFGGYRTPPTMAPALLRRLENEQWPGNVRQLEGVMQRLLVDAIGARELTASLLDEVLPPNKPSGTAPVAQPSTRAVTPADVIAAIDTGTDRARVAESLGISRSTLYRRLRNTTRNAAPARGDTGPDTDVAD